MPYIRIIIISILIPCFLLTGCSTIYYKTIVDYKDPNLIQDTNYRNSPIESYKQVNEYHRSKFEAFPWFNCKDSDGGDCLYALFFLFYGASLAVDIIWTITISPISFLSSGKFRSRKTEVKIYGKLVDTDNNPIPNYQFYVQGHKVMTNSDGIFESVLNYSNSYADNEGILNFEVKSNDYNGLTIEYKKPFKEGTRFINKDGKIIKSKLKAIGNVIVLNPQKTIVNTNKKNTRKKKHNKRTNIQTSEKKETNIQNILESLSRVR